MFVTIKEMYKDSTPHEAPQTNEIACRLRSFKVLQSHGFSYFSKTF